jgi:hypothetical protein
MAELVAVVTVTPRGPRAPSDEDREVRTLEELFNACRDAPPSNLVRVSLRGSEGEVRLNFASFIRST